MKVNSILDSLKIRLCWLTGTLARWRVTSGKPSCAILPRCLVAFFRQGAVAWHTPCSTLAWLKGRGRWLRIVRFEFLRKISKQGGLRKERRSVIWSSAFLC